MNRIPEPQFAPMPLEFSTRHECPGKLDRQSRRNPGRVTTLGSGNAEVRHDVGFQPGNDCPVHGRLAGRVHAAATSHRHHSSHQTHGDPRLPLRDPERF